jgi:hypothetical protein
MVVGADGGQYTCSFDADGRPVLADFDLASIFAELVGADPESRLPQRSQHSGLRRGSSKPPASRTGQERRAETRRIRRVDSQVEKRVQADVAWKSSPRLDAIQDDRLNLRADPHNTPDGVDFVDTMLELIYLALRHRLHACRGLLGVPFEQVLRAQAPRL